jgi:apolipoprotein N-acyltransferase
MPFFEAFSGLWLLIAFVPLLIVENDLALRGKKNVWMWAAFTFVLWNVCTTYWIMYATFWGMVGAVAITAGLETLVFWLFSIVKRKVSKCCGYVAFVAFWITWEHFFLNSEINWPWLTLGNGFSKDIHLIQWYDTTGALGGSLWALVCNVLIACIFCKPKTKYLRRPCIIVLVWICVPITISLIKFYTYTASQGEECRVAVIQPNIDPFTEKFSSMSAMEQLAILLQAADSVADCATHYVIAPETALPGIWENGFNDNSYIGKIRQFCATYPQMRFITGATTFYDYGAIEPESPTARQNKHTNSYYDVFNSALQIDTSGTVGVYHKSKLVIGVEMLPYPKYLKILGKFAIQLGGSSGGLGTQKERTVFASADNKFRVGVIICYESIFGEYCTDYVRNGANLLFIITNDGWWRNTPGHRQHLNYARLRAIEMRRPIARSANTGISAIISERGEILHRTAWWQRDAFAATLTTNAVITPYVRYGDAAAHAAQALSLLIIGWAIVVGRKRKHSATH